VEVAAEVASVVDEASVGAVEGASMMTVLVLVDVRPWLSVATCCAGAFGRSPGKASGRPFVAMAIARELSAFIWAINREVVGSHATANQ
jgi:hypothetical protein